VGNWIEDICTTQIGKYNNTELVPQRIRTGIGRLGTRDIRENNIILKIYKTLYEEERKGKQKLGNRIPLYI
jgi:hypothetical protein